MRATRLRASQSILRYLCGGTVNHGVKLRALSTSARDRPALQGRVLQATCKHSVAKKLIPTFSPQVAAVGNEEVEVVAEQSWRGEAIVGEASLLGKTFPKLNDVIVEAGEGDVIELHPGRQQVDTACAVSSVNDVDPVSLPQRHSLRRPFRVRACVRETGTSGESRSTKC